MSGSLGACFLVYRGIERSDGGECLYRRDSVYPCVLVCEFARHAGSEGLGLSLSKGDKETGMKLKKGVWDTRKQKEKGH